MNYIVDEWLDFDGAHFRVSGATVSHLSDAYDFTTAYGTDIAEHSVWIWKLRIEQLRKYVYIGVARNLKTDCGSFPEFWNGNGYCYHTVSSADSLPICVSCIVVSFMVTYGMASTGGA